MASDLGRLSAVFDEMASEDGLVDADGLATALKIDNPLLARRMFELFDLDGSGGVQSSEFLEVVNRLRSADPRERIRFAFRLHDLDDNGCISHSELSQMIRAGLEQSRLELSEPQIEALVDALFTEADRDADGSIREDEFATTLEKWPELRDALAVGPTAWLQPQAPPWPSAPRPPLRRWIANRVPTLTLATLWIASTVVFFAFGFFAYDGEGLPIQVARGCGMALNYNGMLILLPMMRTTLTRLRQSAIGRSLPVDDAIDFHRWVGQTMFALAVVHSAAHLVNYVRLPASLWEQLFGTTAGLTGAVLLAVFTVMTLTAQQAIRKREYFEVFYFAHLLYIVWFGLLLWHGPRFWMFATVPLVGFLVDRALAAQQSDHKTTIHAGNILTSGVTELVIHRPRHFEYQPGMYVWVRIPAIAPHECHPFTVSSAPESPDFITLHVRSVGNWTRALHRHFRSVEPSTPNVRVWVGGPYGTPAQHIFDSEVAVLVAGGIGVTPFASILSSLAARRQAGSPIGLRKVWFYWINRGQHAFEWFGELLSRLERDNADGFFEIRIFMTAMQARSDLKSATLHIAMDLHHAETRIDLVTGLQARTRPGRPRWDEELQAIAAAHPDTAVDVYLCGPADLAKDVQRHADMRGFSFRRERF